MLATPGDRVAFVVAAVGALVSSGLLLASLDRHEGILLFAINAAIGLGLSVTPYIAASVIRAVLGAGRRWREGITAGLVVYACADIWVQFHVAFRSTSSTDGILWIILLLASLPIVGLVTLVWAIADYWIRSVRSH